MWTFLASKAITLFMLERYDEALDCSHRAQQYPISAIWAYMGELSTIGILGRNGDARETLERALNLQPDLSVGFIKLALPITHEPSRDHFFDGLIKAGVPE
jgi:tetratricopeptide (TPR) repeat protein